MPAIHFSKPDIKIPVAYYFPYQGNSQFLWIVRLPAFFRPLIPHPPLYFRIWQSGHKPSAGNLFPVHGIRFTSWYPASHIMRLDKKTSLIRLQLFFLSQGMMVAKHVFMQQNARPLLYVITDKPPPTTKLTHKETSCTKQRRLRKRLLLMMTSLQAAGLP